MNLLLSYSMGVAGSAERLLNDLKSEVKPDVVHWHNTKGFIPVPSTSSVASFMTSHDYYPVCPRTNLIRPGNGVCLKPEHCQLCLARWRKVPQPWRMGNRRILPIPRDVHIIAPSQFMADRLGADGIETCKVIRNFVPDPGGSIVGNTVPEDRLTYVGILEPHKGVDVLIRAFYESRDNHDFNLSIVGSGSLDTAIKRTVTALGLQKRIEILGGITNERLAQLLSTSAAVVVPSIWYENCPLVVLESLSHGTPVISSAIGGLLEIATPDSGSSIFEPGSVRDLSETITGYWEDREGVPERKMRARRTYEAKFTPDVHIREYLDLI
jgi:glycosyltransferase involved in cell wall biosynthesis